MSEVWSALEGGVVGIAVGTAGATVAEAAVEPSRQEAWKASQSKIHDLQQLAQLVAQALQSVDDVLDDAERNGYHRDQLLAAIQLALTAPSPPEALNLYRRNGIVTTDARLTTDQLHHAYAKAGIEYQYWPALDALQTLQLDPAVIANAIVRGIMPAPFELPVPPPQGEGKVPAFPRSTLDARTEAAASGVDLERLFVMTAIDGRPMSPEAAAAAAFRGIIDPLDYARAISEGDVRNEWAAAIFEHARQIPSSIDFVQARLRGWTDDTGMYAGTARHGMSPDDTDTLFKIHGRPLSWHQAFIGVRRGGELGGPTEGIDEAFMASIRESDIRPEWANIAWAQRYNYPTAFVLRSLTTDGDITQAQAEQILLFEGWEPTLAKQVSEKWAGGSGPPVTSEVKSAKTKLLTTLHTAYVKNGATDASVIAALNAESYPQATIDGLLQTWGNERAFLQAQAPNPPGPIT